MADTIVIVMLSIIAGLVVAVIIYLWWTNSKQKHIVDVYTYQLAESTNQTIREIQRFFDYLKMKPSVKGGVGEGIVDLLLSNLPSDYVIEQYEPPDISARIDFVVKLPESDLYLPIDSKFILPSEFEDLESLDKDSIKKINKTARDRAKEIEKYVESMKTTDFALMYVPDFVYGVLNNETYEKLSEMKIVPTNTSGLLSVIFMINMQHRFVNLNTAACEFGNVQIKLTQGLKGILENMGKGQKQIRRCLNNINTAIKDLEELKVIIETLELEEIENDD